MPVNIPDRLHKKFVDSTADFIAGEGWNCVRLTFFIDTTQSPDLSVADSFRQGAASAGVDEAELMALYDSAIERNPFLASVLDVFDAVQAALWDRGVMTILNNHVSRASWCCNLDDAPGYLAVNNQNLDTQAWLDSLRSVAEWSVGRAGIVDLSLRNELRANPDLLVIVGALNGGTDLSSLRTRKMDTCDVTKAEYGLLCGFVLEQDCDNVEPLFLGEFSCGMTGGPNDGLSDDDCAYLDYLVYYTSNNDADWAQWAIQATYCVREGVIDYDDNYGVLNAEWTDWRNPKFKGLLVSMWEQTQGP